MILDHGGRAMGNIFDVVIIKIRRNIKIHLCLICLALLLFFSLSLSLWIFDSMRITEDKVYNEIVAQMYLSGNDIILSEAEEEKLLNYLDSNNMVIGVNSKGLSDFVKAVNFDTCKKYKGENPYLDKYENPSEEITEDSIALDGNTEISFADTFVANKCTLLDGKIPSKDLPGALISQELAQANGLEIGSILEVEGINGVKKSIPVRGIYSTEAEFTVTEDNYWGTAIFAFSPYNRIFTDFETSKPLITLKYSSSYEIFYKNYRMHDEIESYIRKAPIDIERLFTIYDTTGDSSKQIFSQLTAIHGISVLSFTIVAAADLVVFIIFLIILKRENRAEVRLLSLIGASSKDMVCFQRISFLVIGMPSCVAGILAAKVVYPSLMNFIFMKTKHLEAGVVNPAEYGTKYVLLNPVISHNWLLVLSVCLMIGIVALIIVARNKIE